MRGPLVLSACLLTFACSTLPAEEMADSTAPAAPTSEMVRTDPTAPDSTTSSAPSTPTSTAPVPTTVEVRPAGVAPPEWLGTRLLRLRPGEDNGVAQPTPSELVDRQLWTTDTMPPPSTDAFESRIFEAVPAEVLARSTWTPECPVGAGELAYATVTFWGFDGLPHTGELLTNGAWVEELVAILATLYEHRYPIEEMRVTTPADLDAHPTGDRNNTGSFACRPAVNSQNWSQHASGLAIDLNPFHNPYVKGDLIIPELAESYTDRSEFRVGMVDAVVVALFDAIGWGWGGRWSSSSDWMHFSASGH